MVHFASVDEKQRELRLLCGAPRPAPFTLVARGVTCTACNGILELQRVGVRAPELQPSGHPPQRKVR